MCSQAVHTDFGERQPDNRCAQVILRLRKPRRGRGEPATQVCVPVFESMVPRARAPQLPPTVSLTAASLAHCLASALAALLVLPRRHAAAATVHRWTGIAALLRRRECTPRAAVATGVAAASSHVGSMDDHRRQGAAHASRVAACETLTGRGAVKIASILIVTNEGR